jgi:hypothetical protein
VALCGAARADVGVRMAAIKLVEQAALLYSGRGGAGLPDAAALMACAEALLRGLAQPLAPAGVRQQPGPVVVCTVRALASLAAERPALVRCAMQPLLELATQVRVLARVCARNDHSYTASHVNACPISPDLLLSLAVASHSALCGCMCKGC